MKQLSIKESIRFLNAELNYINSVLTNYTQLNINVIMSRNIIVQPFSIKIGKQTIKVQPDEIRYKNLITKDKLDIHYNISTGRLNYQSLMELFTVAEYTIIDEQESNYRNLKAYITKTIPRLLLPHKLSDKRNLDSAKVAMEMMNSAGSLPYALFVSEDKQIKTFQLVGFDFDDNQIPPEKIKNDILEFYSFM